MPGTPITRFAQSSLLHLKWFQATDPQPAFPPIACTVLTLPPPRRMTRRCRSRCLCQARDAPPTGVPSLESSLKLHDTKVYEPYIRALLKAASHFPILPHPTPRVQFFRLNLAGAVPGRYVNQACVAQGIPKTRFIWSNLYSKWLQATDQQMASGNG